MKISMALKRLFWVEMAANSGTSFFVMNIQLRRIGLAVVCAGALFLGVGATPEADGKSGGDSKLAKELVGTWVHVGVPGNVHAAPGKGERARLKSRTGTHWILMVADPDTGLIQEVFGGTYVVKGDEYVETQTFANEVWQQDTGKSWTFKAKVEGDLMTQIGVGNSFNEVWKKMK